jgi:predicted GTPase
VNRYAQIVIVGRPGCGKTSFLREFLKVAGRVEAKVPYADLNQPYPSRWLAEASGPVTAPVLVISKRGFVQKRFILHDTFALDDDPERENQHRQQLSDTLRTLLAADIVLHLVEASALLDVSSPTSLQVKSMKLHGIDLDLWAYGRSRPRYMMLITKSDTIRKRFCKRDVRRVVGNIPVALVSSSDGRGLLEVKQHVWRMA